MTTHRPSAAALAMLDQQWAEMKLERRRLERWAASLEDKTIELREVQDRRDEVASELRARIEASSAEQKRLSNALRLAAQREASASSSAASASAQLAVLPAVLANELREVEEVEAAMRAVADRARDSAMRLSPSA